MYMYRSTKQKKHLRPSITDCASLEMLVTKQAVRMSPSCSPASLRNTRPSMCFYDQERTLVIKRWLNREDLNASCFTQEWDLTEQLRQ